MAATWRGEPDHVVVHELALAHLVGSQREEGVVPGDNAERRVAHSCSVDEVHGLTRGRENPCRRGVAAAPGPSIRARRVPSADIGFGQMGQGLPVAGLQQFAVGAGSQAAAFGQQENDVLHHPREDALGE